MLFIICVAECHVCCTGVPLRNYLLTHSQWLTVDVPEAGNELISFGDQQSQSTIECVQQLLCREDTELAGSRASLDNDDDDDDIDWATFLPSTATIHSYWVHD